MLFSYRFKKAVAYSTLSQLGFLIVRFSCINSGLTLFHLFTHAFVKRSIFIFIGIIIINTSSQNLNEAGLRVPRGSILTIFTLLILNFLNLIFCSMFTSKEMILLLRVIGNVRVLVTIWVCVSLTLVYTFRMSYILLKISIKPILNSKTSFFLRTFTGAVLYRVLLYFRVYFKLNSLTFYTWCRLKFILPRMLTFLLFRLNTSYFQPLKFSTHISQVVNFYWYSIVGLSYESQIDFILKICNFILGSTNIGHLSSLYFLLLLSLLV